VQGDCSSRDALLLRSRCSMPFFGVRPPPLLCSRPSTLDVYTALAIVQGDCSSRDALLLRSRCSMPFCGVRPPPLLCSRPSTLDVDIALAPATCSGCSITLQIQFPAQHATLRRSSATRLPTIAPSRPTLDETEALMERIHFASAALQLWPFVKLAPRSSKTSDAGTATHIFATSASVADSTCHT
jgi:hypothetical protein